MKPANDLKSVARPLPAEVADVALIAADTCAAVGQVSNSWWHEEVRAGRAPKPVIQQPRFTRWRVSDVRQFWAERASMADAATGGRTTALARAASAEARKPAAVAKAKATRAARLVERQAGAQ